MYASWTYLGADSGSRASYRISTPWACPPSPVNNLYAQKLRFAFLSGYTKGAPDTLLTTFQQFCHHVLHIFAGALTSALRWSPGRGIPAF